jgi:hypothetical protein
MKEVAEAILLTHDMDFGGTPSGETSETATPPRS